MTRILITLLFLSLSAGALTINAISMTTQVDPNTYEAKQVQSSFPATTPKIHAVVAFNHAKKGTKVIGKWIAIDAVQEPDYVIDSTATTLKTPKGVLNFSLGKPQNNWPVGHYRLEVVANQKTIATQYFSIIKASSHRSPLKQPKSFGNITGSWRSTDGQNTLQLPSMNRLVFNGETYNCQVTQNTIVIADYDGPISYAYTLRNNTLSITFPDNSVMTFQRTTGAAARPQTSSTGSQNHLLQGRYCSYSSSSNYSGSYSSSKWVLFDGRSRFSYGSSAYYSGGGDAYANEGGADGAGTYELRGDTIILYYPDGSSSDKVRVYFRQDSGRITEIKHGDTIYAKSLCG